MTYRFRCDYELYKNYKDAFDYDLVKEYFTDYFDDYDYVVGDYSYGKLRLKGFCDRDNKKFNKMNDIDILDDYIKNHCAYGCMYFVLKKVKD